jgi:Copper transport outer membrane protein, MctB
LVVRRAAGDLLVIDFRYHLISIVAVLLALGIGIFAGSGFLGGPILDDLENRLETLEEKNDEYKSVNQDLRSELSLAGDFARAVEPVLVEGSLAGERVVVFEFEGTDSGVVDDLLETIERAGGVTASRVLLRNKFALEQQTDLDQLALIAESSDDRAREVRREAAKDLGIAVAAAGSFAGGEPRGVASAVETVEALFDQLDRAGFLSVDQLEGDEAVPPGTSFVIAGGSQDPAPYEVASFAGELARVIAHRGSGVIVAEPRDSVWGLATGVREDEAATDEVATSDQADTVEGRIATVLGLAAAGRGEIGDYGIGPGATSLIPTPPPGG